METIKLIDVKKDILAKNQTEARTIREELKKKGILLLNLMSSPGSGKTSLIMRTIAALLPDIRTGVIEGDIEGMVDSVRVAKSQTPVVQLRTGGACHLDATMIGAALDLLPLDELDLVIVENVGNLVCPAEFDLGAHLAAVILSFPEGDDKPIKYPLIFSVCQVLLVNKMDLAPWVDFDVARLKDLVYRLNPELKVLEVSCKTGAGLDGWTDFLKEKIALHKR
jgi:hydrogenase nickel incorporation protein HypB